MITLSLKDDGTFLGTIEDADLKVLVDQLEEEHSADTDYFVCSSSIDLIEESGASAHLVELLRRAVGTSEGVDVCWNYG